MLSIFNQLQRTESTSWLLLCRQNESVDRVGAWVRGKKKLPCKVLQCLGGNLDWGAGQKLASVFAGGDGGGR